MIGDHRRPIMIDLLQHSESITRIGLAEDEVLYIYCPVEYLEKYSREELKKIQNAILAEFRQYMPDANIIVGFVDLKFTSITKKDEFAAKLSGDISS